MGIDGTNRSTRPAPTARIVRGSTCAGCHGKPSRRLNSVGRGLGMVLRAGAVAAALMVVIFAGALSRAPQSTRRKPLCVQVPCKP